MAQRLQAEKSGCSGCRDGRILDFDFAMAFQPIVDIETGRVFAYEALVRGSVGEPADDVLALVNADNRYAFDQRCRVKAIEVAARAGILDTLAKLSINFLPDAVYSPLACIQLTLKTAKAHDFPVDRLIFEFTENEEIRDPGHLRSIVEAYKSLGMTTALDDFGAGHAGLNRLAQFQPDIIKLDMALIRDIDRRLPQRIIVEAMVRVSEKLGITLIAEGIETEEEMQTLRTLGILYMQGFHFASPGLETLPMVANGPEEEVSRHAAG